MEIYGKARTTAVRRVPPERRGSAHSRRTRSENQNLGDLSCPNSVGRCVLSPRLHPAGRRPRQFPAFSRSPICVREALDRSMILPRRYSTGLPKKKRPHKRQRIAGLRLAVALTLLSMSGITARSPPSIVSPMRERETAVPLSKQLTRANGKSRRLSLDNQLGSRVSLPRHFVMKQ